MAVPAPPMSRATSSQHPATTASATADGAVAGGDALPGDDDAPDAPHQEAEEAVGEAADGPGDEEERDMPSDKGAQPDTIPSSVEPPVDEFVVERVLDFSIKRREDVFKRGLCLVFLVRWLNYDSSHGSWEPYSALRRVEALHDFARASRHLQDTLRSKEYANLRARHPLRFPESIPER
eukprot:jgi/Tetstr1/432966/TSEL_022303.t1